VVTNYLHNYIHTCTYLYIIPPLAIWVWEGNCTRWFAS